MRISELLMENEVLLESYRDFRKVWNELLDSTAVSDGNRRAGSKTPDQLEALLKDNQKRAALSASEEATHVVKQLKIHNSLDITSWLARLNASARSGRSPEILVHEFRLAVDIIDKAVKSEINNRTPKYTTIKKTPAYIIFDVENFAAARKLRNQVRSPWCIGASDGHFRHYGEESGRSTTIVFFLKEKEGMAFHVDRSGNGIITSHDNDREWTVRGGSVRSSRGYVDFKEEMSKYLGANEVVDFIKFTGMRIKDEQLLPPPKANSGRVGSGDMDIGIIRSLEYELRSGQYATVYKPTRIRRTFSSHVMSDGISAFKSGYPSSIIDDVGEMVKTLQVMESMTKNEDGMADLAVCTLALVNYIGKLQGVLVGGEMDGQVMSTLFQLGRLLNTRGEVASVETYRTVLSNVWLRIEGIMKGLRDSV